MASLSGLQCPGATCVSPARPPSARARGGSFAGRAVQEPSSGCGQLRAGGTRCSGSSASVLAPGMWPQPNLYLGVLCPLLPGHSRPLTVGGLAPRLHPLHCSAPVRPRPGSGPASRKGSGCVGQSAAPRAPGEGRGGEGSRGRGGEGSTGEGSPACPAEAGPPPPEQPDLQGEAEDKGPAEPGHWPAGQHTLCPLNLKGR